MLRDNIARVYEKALALQPNQRIINISINGKLTPSHFQIQQKANLDNNLWDWGLADTPLVDGEAISEISLCDGEHTTVYSDRQPEGMITGKSLTYRQARPTIY
jgi:hypothetical protein